jgi:hypothetical protein
LVIAAGLQSQFAATIAGGFQVPQCRRPPPALR